MTGAYGSEQTSLATGTLRRFAYRVGGSYDLGARIRYAAVEPELAKLKSPARILDAGSGKGELCFAMARRWPNAHILGVDYDEILVEHARRVRSVAMPARDVVFEKRELPHAFPAPFDLVVSIDVLEHIEDDSAFLHGLAAATALGGTLVLHTPATAQRRYLGTFEEQHDHVREGYDRDHLAALLANAGFYDVRIRSTFGALGAIGWEGFQFARRGNAIAKATLPLWYAMSILDGTRVPRHGLGLLAVARR